MGASANLLPFSRTARPRTAASLGYTLHELLVTLALVSLTAAGGAQLWETVQRVRQTAEVNEFLALLALARSEAITRRVRVVFCPSATGEDCETASQEYTAWHPGVLLFADHDGDRRYDEGEPLIRRLTPAASGLAIKSSKRRTRVVYRPDGSAGGTNLTFTFCDRRGTGYARYLIVSNTGRARVASEPPDGGTDDPHERCP